jgi:hypothetical protein
MVLGLPPARGRLCVSGTLLDALWLTVPAFAQATDPQGQLALRDVVRAAYIRAGQSKTHAEIDASRQSALIITDRPSRAGRDRRPCPSRNRSRRPSTGSYQRSLSGTHGVASAAEGVILS